MSTSNIILLLIIAALARIVYAQNRRLTEQDKQLTAQRKQLDAARTELATLKDQLHQLQLLADHIRQYDVIGPGCNSVFNYISAFHPSRQN